MNDLETKIWNTIHNWCDAQSNEIPDQNKRYLMDEIKVLVSSIASNQKKEFICDNHNLKEVDKVEESVFKMCDNCGETETI